ncbi:DNA repair protein RecO [Dokdonella sp.]|uniref:DNA repair protein RecO n=1 Tax=Dokdonella sp. TaxID=2291710 RepID=UPI003527DBEC
MRVDAQPALILHARAWRETSLLLECLTPEYGRVGLVARGVRREKSRLPRGLLQPLQALNLSWLGNGELFTLTHAESTAPPLPIAGERLYSCMYLNELVLRLCARGDPQPELFEHYCTCLNRIAAGEPEGWTLRRFERDLMVALGYGLVLDRDVDDGSALQADREYSYVMDSGPRQWRPNGGALRVSGAALLALHADERPTPQAERELRLLMRALLQDQLNGGSLNAWEIRAGQGKA